jgi:glycosyltransferase involved in cell wall biosynthesis
VRLALWTPRPEAAWVAALVPRLEREAKVEIVVGGAVPDASLDLYHVADDPTHGFVHRALRRRPGVVLLAEWSLHRLARAEAVEQGGVEAYRAEARRAHGTTGAFVARQVESGLGGELPALLAMNDRVLDASLALVAFTEFVRARAKERLPGTPVLHLPLDFVGSPVDTPPRGPARETLGVPTGGFLVALLSAPGERAASALRAVCATEPGLRVQPWPEDPTAERLLLAAADVAVALEHAPRGGLPSPLVRAIVAGVPTLVSAGTGAASDLPEGVAVRVSPGPSEGDELEALLRRLIRDPRLRERVSALARAHADAGRDPASAALALLTLAGDVERSSGEARRAFDARRAQEGTLLASALEEAGWAARSLGLADIPPGIEPRVAPLLREPR